MVDLENIFTVYEITQHIKHILENSVSLLQIEGEVSNLSRPSSGHIYFSLKDEKALIRCVFFSGFGRSLDFIPQNGNKVIISGKLTVYERDGQYQIVVSRIIPYGIGILHIQFEKLKEKLKKEGLFDKEHKKKLPKYPRGIGIITSETGSVLQDILNIISRRYPLDVYLYPAIVQGNEAAPSLIEGIEQITKTTHKIDGKNHFSHVTGESNRHVDIIIIGRGGGSFEDLFCFNDEKLARAISACPIPIISAVGHETDFTICDFVADVRAATPSEAAELAVPNRIEMNNTLQNKKKQLETIVFSGFQDIKHKMLIYKKNLQEMHPQNFINKYQQNMDFYLKRMNNFMISINNIKSKHKQQKEMFQNRCLNNIQLAFNKKALSLNKNHEKLFYITNNKLHISQNELQNRKKLLSGLSPKSILKKGYSIIQKDGKTISTINNLNTKDEISILLKDGQCQAEIV
ncbi:MAG: exodeoxyribonuclease VII large subunit [Candidatus Cloacimonetes bacterium]|nr:exodeoxyribonuclease VII large subunit [Candidatus Cloacimonadota bacterium]